MTETTRICPLAADEIAALEDQRDFLLTSLDDLEREHDAGDVDEHDYVELRDDYTARAARVIRTLDAAQAAAEAPDDGSGSVPPKESGLARVPAWRPFAIGAAVLALLVVAVVWVRADSRERRDGETITGDIRESDSEEFMAALGLTRAGRYDDAIAAFDQILAENPDDVQAMTYKGWTQRLAGDPGAALTTLTAAVRVDEEFPDAYAFLAIVLAYFGEQNPEMNVVALETLDRLEELDPPADLLEQVAPLRTELESRLSATSDTAPPSTPGAPAP